MEQKTFYWIKQGSCRYKVAAKSILFISVNRNTSWMHTCERVYKINCSLRQLTEKITGVKLMQVHRSYAVNLKSVSNFTKKEILLAGHRIPISRAYARNLFKRLKI
jgi:DNA-binding LytR/AlgR family response regulator